MHIKYNLRGQSRRVHDGMGRIGRRDDGSAAPLPFSTPITLTVTIIHEPANTPIPTPPTEPIIPITTSLIPILPITSTTPFSPPVVYTLVSPTTSDIASIPSSSFTPAPTTSTSSSPIPSITSEPNTPNADGSLSNSDSVTVSSGGIAGIVIGCLVVVAIAVLIGLRKRTVRARLKVRGAWANARSLKFIGKPKPEPEEFNTSGDIGSLGMEFTGQQRVSVIRTNDTLAVSGFPQRLPSAYGRDFGSPGLTPRMPVLYTAVVARSFVPSLPDELSISTGEMLRVLQEFDDGWGECMTLRGEVGMIPMECFDKPGGDKGSSVVASPLLSAASLGGEEMSRNARRDSSLPGARREW